MIHVYLKTRSRIEFFRSIEMGPILQTKIWFLPNHNMWLTAGTDFKIRKWNFSPLAKNSQIGNPIEIHSDLVSDIQEITNPPCIATGSLDRTIVLYDLQNGEVLRSFNQHHQTGVMRLKYLRNFGGILFSAGFECYVNAWGPQNLFGDAHLGKMRGHLKPVVSIDVLQERPFVFTMDSENEIWIWDARNLNPLQTIPKPSKNEKLCHGLILISQTCFWAYGSRFIPYDLADVFDEEALA